jgi:hypothetical protein
MGSGFFIARRISWHRASVGLPAIHCDERFGVDGDNPGLAPKG